MNNHPSTQTLRNIDTQAAYIMMAFRTRDPMSCFINQYLSPGLEPIFLPTQAHHTRELVEISKMGVKRIRGTM